jgi:hypothetical protein
MVFEVIAHSFSFLCNISCCDYTTITSTTDEYFCYFYFAAIMSKVAITIF